jgi:hypothetical protein
MKKIASIFLLSSFFTLVSISTNAGCPTNGDICGVCCPIWGPNGEIGSYKCDTGATSAPKDCTASSGGGQVLLPDF